MKDPNEVVFTRRSLEAAMATNCTYYHGVPAQKRFELETPALLNGLNGALQQTKTVLDFGVGVGRLTKAILERYPETKVIGVDNSPNMLQYAKAYIPLKYFVDGRVELHALDDLEKFETGSIDLVLAVYVLQHVDATVLGKVLDQFARVMGNNGNLYVLNSKKRAVPAKDRIKDYMKLRKLLASLENGSRLAQRLSIKLDNKFLLYDDGVDVQAELGRKFTPTVDVSLNGNQHFQKLMRNHFSRLYTKSSIYL